MPQHDVPEYRAMQRRRSNAHQVPVPPAHNTASAGARTSLSISSRTTRGASPPKAPSGWWWKGLVLLLATLIGASLVGLSWLDRQYANRIYPNVSLQGIHLGRMTVPEAEQAVRARFKEVLEQPITIIYQGQSWQPSLAELGVSVDVKRNVAQAYNAGRGSGFVANLRQVSAIYQQGLQLPLRITVDEPELQSYLRRIAVDVERPGREAALTIVDARVQATESAKGQMVLLDDTAAEIGAAIQTLRPQTVTLSTLELEPQLGSTGITEARRTIEAMLSTPLKLTFKDTVFELDQATVADLIRMQRVDNERGTVLNAQLDQPALTKWVTKLADTIGRASVEPRVDWNGGNLRIVREGRVGYRLDIARTVEMINGAVTTSTRELALPVDEVLPRVRPETLANLGIVELIATGKSDFAGSAPYRVTNIKAGANIINGILIAPDEEFSFNENVGNIDEANGFVEGYAIIGNRTQKEWGGGICQISTTLFRAAFYAGLPFTEKNPHRFRISWYEKYDPIGMDAAIFTGGGPDLRFINDTGNWLLIQSYVNDADSSVTYALYGTPVPGRTIERSEPKISNETPAPADPVWIDDPELPVGEIKQTDVARGGMEIEIIRNIKHNGEVIRTDQFITKFEAWPNIYVKHPQTPVPSQP